MEDAMDVLGSLRRSAQRLWQQVPAPVRNVAATAVAPVRTLGNQIRSLGTQVQDRFEGVQRGLTARRPGPPALPAPALPPAARPTSTTRPASAPRPPQAPTPAPAHPLAALSQGVAAAGRGLTDAGRNLDGFLVGQMGRSERALGSHDLARAGSGFGRAVTEIVTGTMQLAGGALQLADARTREAAVKTAGDVAAAVARDPGRVAGAIRDQAVRAWNDDPWRMGGAIVGNLVPVGAALKAVTGAGRAAQTASAAGRVVRGLGAGGDAARVAVAALPPPSTAARVAADATLAARSATAARVVESGSAFPPLRSVDDYAALLARQTAEGSVPLGGVARPGILNPFTDKSGQNLWAVGAGAGRRELARDGDMLDYFLPQGSPLPPGAIRAETAVPGELVAIANSLSSRGSAASLAGGEATAQGIDPLMEMITAGKTYDRVFVPAGPHIQVNTSTRLREVHNGLGAAERSLGPETARQLRETLKPLSIAEQHKIMGELGLLP
jgi:hypothetical protein